MDWNTLGAVALGGAISLGSAYLLEWRRERSAASKVAAATAEELRTAGRLVRDEMQDAMAEIERAETDDYFPLSIELSLEHWSAHSTTLARLLASPEEWSRVINAVDAIKALNRDHFSEDRPRAATGDEMNRLDENYRSLENASSLLWRVSGDEPQ